MKKSVLSGAINVKMKRIFATIIFLSLLVKIFLSATYLFRNSGSDRVNIVGIKDEEPLDMIYIGGSSAVQYWEPLKAWADYGFTSYSLGTNGIQAECIKYLAKYALNYHKPELLVIDVRAFQNYKTEVENGNGLRPTSDSLDFTIDRLKLIYEYLNKREFLSGDKVDDLPFYLDIMTYHTDYSALASQDNWGFINNKGNSKTKGTTWQSSYRYLDKPENIETDIRGEISEQCLETLYGLLEFCREKDLEVLFTVCPYQIEEEHWEMYNALEDIITSYGFDFLNTNKYYDEMKIDFSMDFYNHAHVNAYGAGKYTEFLGNYLVEHYNLPDHRDEEIYADWNEESGQFLEAEKRMEDRIDAEILKVQEGKEIANSIRDTTDLLEWCVLANDSRFTILAVGNEGLFERIPFTDQKALSFLGLDVTQDCSNYIRVACGGDVIYSNIETKEKHYEMTVGVADTNCRIDNSAEEASILIDDNEYSRQGDGINIVVFENDYDYVVDSFVLKCDEKGIVKLER